MDYKTLLHDPQSAALWHAIALRRLHNYRAARECALNHGDALAGLPDTPGYPEISDTYVRLIEDFIDQRIDKTNVARCALDLLAAIAQDRQFTYIFEEGSVVSMERDIADEIRLIERLSGWINERDIEEALAHERRELQKPRAMPEPAGGLDPARKADLRARAEALAAEFSPATLSRGDAGLIEAERRLRDLRARAKELYGDFPIDMQVETDIMEPTTIATESALCEFIEETPPDTGLGAMVKLRHLNSDGGANHDVAIAQIAEWLGREVKQREAQQ